MDSEQFKLLIEAMNKNQQQLLDSLLSNRSSETGTGGDKESKSSLIKISHVPPFENFDQSKEKFKYYRQRFENYISMKDLSSDKKKCAQMLLNSIGASNYNMLASLVAPRTPGQLDYDEIIFELKKHLAPKRSTHVSQNYFLSTYQDEQSTIADYVATLRRDIADCEFKVSCECGKNVSAADLFLRAQFIRGIKDNWIKEQILQSEIIKFNDIVTKAIALEASKIDSRELSKSTPSSTSINAFNEVHKVGKFKRQSRKENYQPNQTQNKFKMNQTYKARSKSRGRIDFEKLGINNLCLRCGRNNHLSIKCRTNASNLKCSSCNMTGHVSKVCIKTLIKNKMPNTPYVSTNQIDKYEFLGVNKIIDIYDQPMTDTVVDVKKYYTFVKIENRNQKFEVDTGAGYTLIPENQFTKLGIKNKLLPTNIAFRSYTQNVFLPLGKVKVNVEHKGVYSYEDMYVISNGFEPLIGRVWVRHLKINLEEIDQELQEESNDQQILSISNVSEIEQAFSEIFVQKVGCVPNFVIKLKLREGAKPSYTPERDVPYALREQVEQELDNLEAAGIITKSTTSDWGSPLVVIPKGDGTVRLCVDYKVGVNDLLVNTNYPIKKIDEVLHSLRNSKYFCRLDLFKAYLLLSTDEESSIIQTISTHRGTYRMNRLSFGIKTAPAEFNRIIDQILRGLPSTISYFDDIVVHGKTKEECQKNLISCLQRLRKYDLHLNQKKCTYFQTKIEYLGHVVEHNKISKSPSKVKAILNMPSPKNVPELRRFLGMITYYSRFLPNASTVTYPLRKLLKKDQKFYWSTECKATFIKLKNEISSDRVIIPFDPDLPVSLATDASPTGIAAVLSHNINDIEKPIAFASRSLSNAEQNYSQLDREALAIVFGVDHFFDYLYGRHFTLVTDNQPLTRIFHQKSKFPKMTSARLLRYASFLAGFNYNVKFRKGTENQNVDCLSRASIKQENSSSDMAINEEVHRVCSSSVFQITSENLTPETIIRETGKDEDLSRIKRELKSTSIESNYTLNEGILFKNDRIVIPKSLQPEILKELHSTHLGITKMKQLARRYCTWNNIDKDIEKLVKSCEECLAIKHKPAKAPVHHWDPPTNNWDRIHIDFAGPHQGFYYFVLIDAKSRWAEIEVLREAPNSSNTIKLLNKIFSSHGYPFVMVSDNASIFTSEHFQNYCRTNGIKQKYIAPGHPATNGLAERNVQTLKNRLKAMANENLPMNMKIQKILLRYRATPLANGKSPAEMYLHRSIRIKLDAIRPYREEKSNQPILSRTRSLQVGERVLASFVSHNKDIWKLGTITRKLGKLHYIITLDEGRSIKRHINQLKQTEIQKKSVTFAKSLVQAEANADQKSTVKWDPLCYETKAPNAVQENYPVENENQMVEDPNQPNPELQLRRSTRQRRPPQYLQDYVT